MTRLVRWRVRDWTSCFLAFRFSSDNEAERYLSSTGVPMPIRTTVALDRKSIGSRSKENSSKKMSRLRNPSSPHEPEDAAAAAAIVAVQNNMTDNDSSWPQFEDEDYIVFCFKGDGVFDVIKNGNSEPSNCIDLVSASSRPVSRKLNYGEDDKAAKRYNNNNEKKINDGDHILSPQKDEEGEMDNIYMDEELAMGGNRMANHNEVINDLTMVALPAESSDSNHSDVSNGSFAFPVLGWEWSGSPVQMPKSEGLQLRKHKARCVGFQCCKF